MPSTSNLLKGQYLVLGDINKGSYGVVSLAKDIKNDDELVAIKCISKSSYEEAVYEVEMHKRLGHNKNVVELIDFFEEDGKAYLVLEYCAPGDLYEAIKAGRGPREQNCVLDFMLQLIDVVEYCHAKGVYHRDIKPENILIGNDGSVKLADWGLATTIKLNSEFGIGSERYMAPELFDQANTRDYDAEKADIWSIGICLLNILFGRNPFTVASQKDKLFLDFATSREALFDIFPSLSEDVFVALRHCLTMDPDNRNLTKFRKELLTIRMWTTDEYYEEEEEEYEYEYENYDNEINEKEYENENENDNKKYKINKNYENDNNDDVKDEDITGTTPTIHTFDEPAIVTTPAIRPKLPFMSTTTNRQPFRTPTGLQNSNIKYDIDWNRTMQFTPPTKGHLFFPNSKVKTPSNLSYVLSVKNGLPMKSVHEDEEESTLLVDSVSSSRRRRDSDGSSINIDDGVHDDVFAMDDSELSDSFTKLSLAASSTSTTNHVNIPAQRHQTERNSSGSDSSISSVPSLVQSTIEEQQQPSLPSQRFTFNAASSSFIPVSSRITVQGTSPDTPCKDRTSFFPASAPPSNDFLNLGKSWSDIDFEDDEEFLPEDNFYLNRLRDTVSSSGTDAATVSRNSLTVPGKQSHAVNIKSISGPSSHNPTIAGKSHPNPGQTWVYPHWVN